MSVSLWQRAVSKDSITADCLVIGGGFAGLCTALALQDRGADALIVERHHLAWGASGRNAGYMMRGAADNYAAAINSYGRESAKALWTLTEQNLAGMIQRGAEPHSRACPSCLLAFNEEELAQLRASHDLLLEDGFQSIWLDTHDDDAWRTGLALGGLVNPNDRVCNPCHIAGLLRDQLSRPMMEGVEVYEIASDARTVETSAGRIECGRVIVCTNAYLNALLTHDAPQIEPNRAQMLACAAQGHRLDFAYYANHGGEYFRQHDDSTLLFGGKRLSHAEQERTQSNATSLGVQSELERFAAGVLGSPIQVNARWAGTMGFTKDHLPLAGPVPGVENEWIWTIAGFNGHGASMAHETARRTVEAMLKGSTSAPPPFPLDRPGLN